MYNDVLGKLAGYCETLVSVSVIMMAAFTTGSLSKVRSKSRKVFMFENFSKPMQLVVTAVVAFGGAAVLKLVLVYFLAYKYFQSYCSLVMSREVFFVSEGHRKPETYRANLCDQHKFCASRSVLLRTE